MPEKLENGEAGYLFTNLVGKSFMVAIYCGYASSFGQYVAREYKVRARSSKTCLSSSDYIFNSNLAQFKFSAGLVIYTTPLDWSISRPWRLRPLRCHGAYVKNNLHAWCEIKKYINTLRVIIIWHRVRSLTLYSLVRGK